MEEKEYIKSRIEELMKRSSDKGIVTATNFLSFSEQTLFFEYLNENKINYDENNYIKSLDISFLFEGGNSNNDRNVIFFIPNYYEINDFKKEFLKDYISLIHIENINNKFASKLTHRDYLGAIMNLGIEREKFGDILLGEFDAYLFLKTECKDLVLNDLKKVKDNNVKVKENNLNECPYSINLIEKNINVSSLRIDSLVAEVFNISRSKAQELVENGFVFIDMKTIMNNSYIVKENERIAVKSKGKFIFKNVVKRTRKDRFLVLVEIFG